jgi:UDP-N-acetylglucosamine--N-acetylmuramyl-(pentapeptide) pyrophosphoryl-undecaprenol N-acetylglucosamine transferase
MRDTPAESLSKSGIRDLRSATSTYLFAGGGSGGHLYPGIAVARELLAVRPEARVLFVGSDRPLERRILDAEGLDHVALPAASSAELARNPIGFARRNWSAFRDAKRLLGSCSPCAVVGLGGFASVPLVVAAQQGGLPTLLLEQNVTPGRATRWLAGRAQRVCLSFSETAAFLPRSARCVMTGNPVRRDIAGITAERVEKPEHTPKQLLILGGSQGARSLNRIVCNALVQLSGNLAGWEIVHQTGPADAATVREQYARTTLPVTVHEFIEDLGRLYRATDVVVSRAGATTLAELACCGLPAVLVPFPHAARDHQTANAAWYAERDATLLIREAEHAAPSLADALRSLLHDERLRQRMSERSRNTARPYAAQDVVQELLSVAHRAAA